jgi:ribonuclease P protein component
LTLLETEYIITEKGVKNEKNVSAFKNQKGEGPRFQKKEQDQRRQKGFKAEKVEKKKKTDREDQREMMKKEGFPKSLRIKNKKEWDEVIKKGERSFSHNLLLLRLKTAEKENKFGVALSSGLKGAVKRNRIKRVLREILRRNKDRFLPGEKVILIYRSKVTEISYHEILNEFSRLF